MHRKITFCEQVKLTEERMKRNKGPRCKRGGMKSKGLFISVTTDDVQLTRIMENPLWFQQDYSY